MLFVVVGVRAFADPVAAGPAERPLAPTWSIGAGLSFGFGGLAFGGGLGSIPGATPSLGGLIAVSGASPSVSLERMFSHQFALGVGLEGNVSTNSTVGSAQRPVAGGASLGLSPRFTPSPESWPVALTFYATSSVGWNAGGFESVAGRQEYQQLQLALGGGIALEKRFFERLAVRVQAQLLRVTFFRTWNSIPLAVSDETIISRSVSSSFSAGLVPAPSMELRLYL